MYELVLIHPITVIPPPTLQPIPKVYDLTAHFLTVLSGKQGNRRHGCVQKASP
jgi:hypothetical protein